MPTTSGGVKADAMDDFSKFFFFCPRGRLERVARSPLHRPRSSFSCSLSLSSLLHTPLFLSHEERA